MSKIQRISVYNLKAISELTADFNGCTAIVTGRNNSGKTTFLRTPIDRIRGSKPEIILKLNEKEGFTELDLTTGEKFRWVFDSKTKAGEKLIFITKDNIKKPLTREIADRYFPATFDVDKFLIAQPKQQRKMLQELVGVDFTEVDKRYDDAYLKRTDLNRTAAEQKTIFEAMPQPEKVEAVLLDDLLKEKEGFRKKLNDLYLAYKKQNDEARKLWQDQCEDMRKNVQEFNVLQHNRVVEYNECVSSVEILSNAGYKNPDLDKFLEKLNSAIESIKTYVAPPEPEYIKELPDDSALKEVDERINAANETNRKAQEYTDWLRAKNKNTDAQKAAGEANEKVQAIEKERMDIIKAAKMPEGFTFSDDGILYNGLPFTREQLSSSGIYIAALKLAAMTLGEVRTLHFDASFLDKQNLLEIEKWATENDLQLLIERPDYEGGEIEYHLIHHNETIPA